MQIEKNKLYKCGSKKWLSKNIGNFKNISLKKLQNNNMFNCFNFKKINKPIQEPKKNLKIIHKNIHNILSQIDSPDYLFSKKEKSCIDKAKLHKENSYMVKMDIKSFYPNCQKKYIFKFFKNNLKMVSDVAFIISNIICYENALPYGSPLSPTLCFWAYKNMFDEIYEVAKENNLIFTLYVDDMCFSSNFPLNKKFHLRINYILKKYGHQLKNKKIKYYAKSQNKEITGVVINNKKELKVANRIRKKIISNKNSNNKSSLQGLINYSQQIEPNIFDGIKRYL